MTAPLSALVILNGSPPPNSLIAEKWDQYDLKISADGASNFLVDKGYTPDIVIGDCDSILPEVREKIAKEKLICIADQNTTDGEKAIQFCLRKGVKNVDFLGALGKRFDHSLYNIELLNQCLMKGMISSFYTPSDQIFLINKGQSLRGKIGERISFFSVFGETKGVSTYGLTYPISSQTMRFGAFSSISNTFSQEIAEITIEKGILLVVREQAASGN